MDCSGSGLRGLSIDRIGVSRRARVRAEARGRGAEHLCALWLALKGYTLLAHRARTGYGELDLIALKKGVLVVVEVKARASLAAALEAVSFEQKRRIARSAETWARRNGFGAAPIRFDLMAVRPWRLPAHLRGAFLEGDN